VERPREIDVSGAARHRMWLGAILLVAGLVGHLLAAHRIGGSPVAYQHHIAGFFGISIVTGAIIAGLGARFWKGRHDITLLILGALQALLGLLVYADTSRVS
jgi:hypothetical protein